MYLDNTWKSEYVDVDLSIPSAQEGRIQRVNIVIGNPQMSLHMFLSWRPPDNKRQNRGRMTSIEIAADNNFSLSQHYIRYSGFLRGKKVLRSSN